MAITSNVLRVQVESAAKNGTLGTQGAIGNNQILFDTNINTNNNNLVVSPTFVERQVIIRQGETDEELNLINSVDVDGLTCTCEHDWVSNPASGDTYHVSYVLPDVATITGMDQDSTTQEYITDRALNVGKEAVTFAFLSMGLGDRMRLADSGGGNQALNVINGSLFAMGTAKNGDKTPGGQITFLNNVDGETVVEIQNGGLFRGYDFSLVGAYAHFGISLEFKIIAGANYDWQKAHLVGMTAPFESRRNHLKDTFEVARFTVAETKASSMWTGWLKSECDKSVYDAILNEPDNAKVIILVEDE